MKTEDPAASNIFSASCSLAARAFVIFRFEPARTSKKLEVHCGR